MSVTQSKVQMKLEQIARLRVAGNKDLAIAEEIGLSYAGLARILALPEYKECEARVHDELIGKMDNALADSRTELIRKKKAEALKQQIRDAVPDALQNVLDAVQQKRDLRASLELLDRDPDCVAIKRNKSTVEASVTPGQARLTQTTVDKIRQDADATRDLLIKTGQVVQAEAQA